MGIWARTLAESWAMNHWEEKLEENQEQIWQRSQPREQTIQSYSQPLMLPPESETPELNHRYTPVPMGRPLQSDPTGGTNLKK
jgi:hypothetical protein